MDVITYVPEEGVLTCFAFYMASSGECVTTYILHQINYLNRKGLFTLLCGANALQMTCNSMAEFASHSGQTPTRQFFWSAAGFGWHECEHPNPVRICRSDCDV